MSIVNEFRSLVSDWLLYAAIRAAPKHDRSLLASVVSTYLHETFKSMAARR